jgi:type IV pilus assembly protein PilV
MNAGRNHSCTAHGFSLVEIMVALIVLSVGLLGIARMQSLALSSTSVASQRSMAAIEAESLAGAMHANRGYWSNSDPSAATIQVAGSAVTVTAGAPNLSTALAAATDCSAGICTPEKMAAFDLTKWAGDMNGVLPGNYTLVQCGNVTPVTCVITVKWAESAMGVNANQASVQTSAVNTAVIQNSVYILYVQP